MERIRTMFKTHGAVILFFTLFLLYGLMTVKDFGISTDELIERNSSLITYRYMVPSVADVVTEAVNFPELTPLKEYQDRYYGMAVQIPAVVVEHLFGFRLDIRKVFLMRHLYNFLMFFAATVFFYKICRKLGHGTRMSLLGTSMLILMPRLLAHSFYNVKDMMFLSVFVITLYFGFLCVEGFSWKRLIPFAFFGALCTNIRVVGAMVVAVCLVTAFCKSFWEKRWKQTFLYCWAAAFLCFGFYYIMTPVIWHDTWQEIRNLLDVFSNYVVWYTRTYFMGQYILSTELPWYYLFVNIGITTPLCYLLLFVCGSVALVMAGISAIRSRQRPEAAGWYYICLTVNLVVPFVYVVVSRPVLYNGWRHFYFVYPMMVLVMLYGVTALGRVIRPKRAQYVYRGLVAAGVLSVAVWIGWNHPYEYAFFNRAALPFVTEYFQKDYWNVSHYDLLRYACETDWREELKVWILPENTIVFMPPEHRSRIVHVEKQDDADYVVTAYTASCETERLNQYYLYDEPKAIWVDGVKISSLFRRAYDPVLRTSLEETGETLRYHVNGMAWEMYREGNETVLHGRCPEKMTLDKIFVQGMDGQIMEGMQMEVSADGVQYEPVPLVREFAHVETDRSGFCAGMTVTDVVIRHKTAEQVSLSVSLLKSRVPGEMPAGAVSVISGVEASDRREEAELAFDGNLETRWTSGEAQKEGMYFELALAEPVELCQITLDTYTSPGDEGKNLQVFCSENGVDWTQADAVTEDGKSYTFSPQKCRYVRLKVGAVEEGTMNNWSIHEIEMMTEWRP